MAAPTLRETLSQLEPSAFTTIEGRLPHGGSLQARRVGEDAFAWFWRFPLGDGRMGRERIGFVDLTATPKALQPTAKGYGKAAALEACRVLGQTHQQHAGGIRGHKADQVEAEQRKQLDRIERAEKSLGALVDAYIAHLKAKGRRSYVDAANLLGAHLLKAFPQLAAKPAADVTIDDAVDAQRKLIDAGKGRTANKLRAYARAAFQCAIDVRTDATIPATFRGFGLTSNPFAATRRAAAFDRADKRPLPLPELRSYWKAIAKADGMLGAVLRLHLLSGAQRIEQLIRLRADDINGSTFTLHDAKGRPGSPPRPHVLPITDQIRVELEKLTTKPFAISTTDGEKPISASTLAGFLKELAAGGKVPDGFQLKRLRSGVETLLAEHGVSRDVRAALQSHGQSGVQARHYDASEHLPAKRAALEALYSLISRADAGGKVVALRGRPKKANTP